MSQVYDAGSTLSHHGINVSYLLVLKRILEIQNVQPMLAKNYVGPASQHWVDVIFLYHLIKCRPTDNSFHELIDITLRLLYIHIHFKDNDFTQSDDHSYDSFLKTNE